MTDTNITTDYTNPESIMKFNMYDTKAMGLLSERNVDRKHMVVMEEVGGLFQITNFFLTYLIRI